MLPPWHCWHRQRRGRCGLCQPRGDYPRGPTGLPPPRPRPPPLLLGADPYRWWRWLLLMAHEVGHVRQAQHFGFDSWGRTRFALWASLKYVESFLRNGRYAHDRAPFEVDAEKGRRALALLMELTGGCTADHPVVAMALCNDHTGMHRWLEEQAAAVQRARASVAQ